VSTIAQSVVKNYLTTSNLELNPDVPFYFSQSTWNFIVSSLTRAAQKKDRKVTSGTIALWLNKFGYYKWQKVDKFYTWRDVYDEYRKRWEPFGLRLADYYIIRMEYKRRVLSDPRRGPHLGRVYGTKMPSNVKSKDFMTPKDPFAKDAVMSILNPPTEDLSELDSRVETAVSKIMDHYGISELDARKTVFEGIFFLHAVTAYFEDTIRGYIEESGKTYEQLSPTELALLYFAAEALYAKVEKELRKERRKSDLIGWGLVVLTVAAAFIAAHPSVLAKIWGAVTSAAGAAASAAKAAYEAGKWIYKNIVKPASEAGIIKPPGEEAPPPPPPPGGEEEEAGRAGIPLALIAAGALALIALTSTE